MIKDEIREIELVWELKEKLHGEPSLWEIANYLMLLWRILVNVDRDPRFT